MADFASKVNDQHRREGFKTPPIARSGVSQRARRENALAVQKRRRAQQIDSARNLDLFANLTIDGGDSDEEPPGPQQHGGVAAFASLLGPGTATGSSSHRSDAMSEDPSMFARKKKKKAKKPSKYANRCMYAELLEMIALDESDGLYMEDGVPPDLQTAWVALAPVPKGKRCLAVCNQANGVTGTVRNTFLKSRLKGTTILTFPSPLPADTIVDCVLDENWKQTGILHVLDVIRWKGQEIGDCEAQFRFWWRDTRLAELPPPNVASSTSTLHPSPSTPHPTPTFTYPITLSPIPFHTNLTYANLLGSIIPQARNVRMCSVIIPRLSSGPSSGQPNEWDDGRMDIYSQGTNGHLHDLNGDRSDMMMDDGDPGAMRLKLAISSRTAHAQVAVSVESDGILLYVSEASYDAGSSPLSSWIPLICHAPILGNESRIAGNSQPTLGGASPMDVFERNIHRRLLIEGAI